MRRWLSFIAILALLVLPAVAAEVPRKAPELAVALPDGRQILLSQFRGQVVLIEFLHTTCVHCQHSSVTLERLRKELGPRGFQVIGVAFNDNALMLVPDFVRQLGLTFPVGVGGRDEVLSYLQHPLVKPLYVPQMVIVDRKGIIRGQHGGEDDFFTNLEPNLRAVIEVLLKEPAAGQATRPKPRAAKTAAASRQAAQ